MVVLSAQLRDRGAAEECAQVGVAPIAPAPELDVLIDLHDAIRELPERQREVITLHYLADLSVAVIAAQLGISEGTVKSQLHDARHALRGDHHERPIP